MFFERACGALGRYACVVVYSWMSKLLARGIDSCVISNETDHLQSTIALLLSFGITVIQFKELNYYYYTENRPNFVAVSKLFSENLNSLACGSSLKAFTSNVRYVYV